MNSLTELSGMQIRMAAAAIAEARRSLPREEPAEAPVKAVEGASAGPAESAAGAPGSVGLAAPPEASASPGEGAAAGEAAAGATGDASAPDEAPPADAPAAPAAPKAEAGESEAVKAALDEAVARATGLAGERLAMLRAAVVASGSRTKDVRVVRVFGVEEPLRGAQKIGEHQYLVEFLPAVMKQVAGGSKEEHGRGGGGGRRGPGKGGGDRGAKGSTTGGFSMDSLRDDRKGARGAGGGRGWPGGGPGAGRGPGGSGGPPRPPAGGPKK